jgi:hypothetical protein
LAIFRTTTQIKRNVVDPGRYELLLGASSADIRQRPIRRCASVSKASKTAEPRRARLRCNRRNAVAVQPAARFDLLHHANESRNPAANRGAR